MVIFYSYVNVYLMKFTLIFSWSIFEAEDSLIGYLAIMANNGEQW
jgi:hypothetical protein